MRFGSFAAIALVLSGVGLYALTAYGVSQRRQAFAMERTLQGLLVQTGATDPITLTAALVLLIVVVLNASVWPAFRAARLSPLSSLRYD